MPTNSEEKTVAAVLLDAMKVQGMTFEKLVQTTGISDRFLALLLEENFEKLPASPYLHGYILKIGEALRFDGERLWQEYFKNSNGMRRSGAADTLPGKRPEVRARSRKVIAIGIAIIVVVLGYVAYRIQQSLGEPALATNITNDMRVTAAEFDVKGTIDPRDRIILNGAQLYPDTKGNFEKKVELQPGFNTLAFTVKKFLGSEYTINKQIFYQTSSTAPMGSGQANSPHASTTPKNATSTAR